MHYSVSGLGMREIKAVRTISRVASEELIAQGRPISQETRGGSGEGEGGIKRRRQDVSLAGNRLSVSLSLTVCLSLAECLPGLFDCEISAFNAR